MVRYSLNFQLWSTNLEGNQIRDWEYIGLNKIRDGSCVLCNKRDGRKGESERHRQRRRGRMKSYCYLFIYRAFCLGNICSRGQVYGPVCLRTRPVILWINLIDFSDISIGSIKTYIGIAIRVISGVKLIPNYIIMILKKFNLTRKIGNQPNQSIQF